MPPLPSSTSLPPPPMIDVVAALAAQVVDALVADQEVGAGAAGDVLGADDLVLLGAAAGAVVGQAVEPDGTRPRSGRWPRRTRDRCPCRRPCRSAPGPPVSVSSPAAPVQRVGAGRRRRGCRCRRSPSRSVVAVAAGEDVAAGRAADRCRCRRRRETDVVAVPALEHVGGAVAASRVSSPAPPSEVLDASRSNARRPPDTDARARARRQARDREGRRDEVRVAHGVAAVAVAARRPCRACRRVRAAAPGAARRRRLRRRASRCPGSPVSVSSPPPPVTPSMLVEGLRHSADGRRPAVRLATISIARSA